VWGHGVADAPTSERFQFGVTSVECTDADREGEVERFLAGLEFKVFDGDDAKRQVGCSPAEPRGLCDRARRTVDAQDVLDAARHLACGRACPATDFKNPQPRFQR
jgi:hypothetical protein